MLLLSEERRGLFCSATPLTLGRAVRLCNSLGVLGWHLSVSLCFYFFLCFFVFFPSLLFVCYINSLFFKKTVPTVGGDVKIVKLRILNNPIKRSKVLHYLHHLDAHVIYLKCTEIQKN